MWIIVPNYFWVGMTSIQISSISHWLFMILSSERVFLYREERVKYSNQVLWRNGRNGRVALVTKFNEVRSYSWIRSQVDYDWMISDSLLVEIKISQQIEHIYFFLENLNWYFNWFWSYGSNVFYRLIWTNRIPSKQFLKYSSHIW